MDKNLVKSIFVSNRANSNYFITKLNSIFEKHDFSSYTNFKWDINPDIQKNRHSDEKRWGVWVLINGEWKWSWINTFETNYSAILKLIEYFNHTELGLSQPITYYELTNNFITQCNRLLLFIYHNTSDVFGFEGNTKLSRKLQVATAYSWYDSKFSELNFIKQYNPNNESVFIPKNRGNGDDYMYGIDFWIGDVTYQHKHDRVEFVDDLCLLYSPNLHKRKHTRVNRFVFEYGDTIYVFDTTNIEDPRIIEYRDKLSIPNDRLLDVIDVIVDPNVMVCKSIFDLCMSNNFVFEMFDSKTPYVNIDEKERSIVIGFEGVDLESISTELKNSLNYLIFLTNSEANVSEYSPSPIT